jgi:hypothetical protein
MHALGWLTDFQKKTQVGDGIYNNNNNLKSKTKE